MRLKIWIDQDKEKKKSKAFLTWSDDESDIEIESEDEVAQLSFAGFDESFSENEEVFFTPPKSFISEDLLTLQAQIRKLRNKN
ncbi:hypothetical protein ACR2XN_28805, partial [Klebsiella pneumoniae]